MRQLNAAGEGAAAAKDAQKRRGAKRVGAMKKREKINRQRLYVEGTAIIGEYYAAHCNVGRLKKERARRERGTVCNAIAQ